jgi:ferric-dicitrate binding protein FerR (iron transport regulator)
MVTLETPLGSKLKTTLPDGTEVWQNAGTTLQYPVKFTRKNRMVYLSGEAYLHVQSDKLNPFLVHTENGSVKVTGTRFNVSAFAEDGATTVVLEEGAVAYSSKKSPGTTNLLKPGEQIIDDKSNSKVTKSIADVEKHTAWKDGRLVFRNDRLAEVVIKLRRWYGADIDLIEKNDGLKNLTFTLTIEQETLPQVLEYLAQAAPLRIGSQKVDKSNETSLIKTKYTISNR